MTQLKDYSFDDQLSFIGHFIENCNPILNKSQLNPNEQKKTITSDSFLLNQIIQQP